MPKPKKDTADKRFCKNCAQKFSRKTYQQEFCCGNCRKEFWKHGGVSLRRIFEYVDRRIDERLAGRKFVDPLTQRAGV